MRPLNAREFAEQLRLEGNEFADEILDLIDIEEEVAEPYSELCGDIEHYAPDKLKNTHNEHARTVEWLGDRSALLTEIEDQLRDDGREPEGTQDAGDIVKELIDEFGNFETIMREHGGWTEGDLQDALFALIERADKAPKLEYDL